MPLSREPRPLWLQRVLLGAALMALMGACGGGSGGAGGAVDDDPTALQGEATGACTQAIVDGHNLEAAGRPEPFLASVRACRSLGEWTAAAKQFGIDLKGREAQFVDNTCAASTADVQASKICREAKAVASNPSRMP